MSSSQNQSMTRQEVPKIDIAVLDSYVGLYQLGDFTIWRIAINEGKLTATFSSEQQSALELTPLSDTEFEIPATNTQLTFICESQSVASKLIIHQYGADIEGPRIDEPTAMQIMDKLRQRIEAAMPMPGSEIALRQLIEGIMNGTPNYNQMRPAFANLLRTQLPQLRAIATYLGSIQSIEFQGVGSQGWDVYKVIREQGVTRYRINLAADGKIAGASAIVVDGPLSLGP